MENQLPWHLGTDMRHFRQRTEGHAVIMGRKTYESIGRPLPKRLNIVLSRDVFNDSDNLKWARDPQTALMFADQYSIFNLRKEFFVIGGENIYELFDRYINLVYLTDVFTGSINGDAKFDRKFDLREWYFKFEKEFQKSDIDDYSFRISCIVRRKPFHRFISKNEFLTKSDDAWRAWDDYEAMMSRKDPDEVLSVEQLDLLARL